MAVYVPLPVNGTVASSFSTKSWWSSSPIVYGGYSYSPFTFDSVRSYFSSIASNPSYPSFYRSWALDVSTYEDDFWWLNVLWCIFPILCPLFVHFLEIVFDKKARYWWRSQRSFQPPLWLNCLCVFQFIIANNIGLFIARYLLSRPLHSDHSYSLFDFCQWIIFMPMIDVITWFTHWLQHYYPFLYRWSHSTHHKVKFSTMWIVYYANPIDFLINTLWLYTVLFWAFDFHFAQTVIVVIANTTHLTLTHSNYREISNGHHQIHHLEPRFNFCPGNPLVDKIFGTLLTVEEYSKTRDPEKLDGGDKIE